MTKLSVEFVKFDEFGVVPGSGWVIKEDGKRLDWPMLATREEATGDAIEFHSARRQLASDEASERNFLRFPDAISPEPGYNAQ
jgi:hypothetical protein